MKRGGRPSRPGVARRTPASLADGADPGWERAARHRLDAAADRAEALTEPADPPVRDRARAGRSGREVGWATRSAGEDSRHSGCRDGGQASRRIALTSSGSLLRPIADSVIDSATSRTFRCV
jgi:hypothetical protein